MRFRPFCSLKLQDFTIRRNEKLSRIDPFRFNGAAQFGARDRRVVERLHMDGNDACIPRQFACGDALLGIHDDQIAIPFGTQE
jgi:hypothetical protein